MRALYHDSDLQRWTNFPSSSEEQRAVAGRCRGTFDPCDWVAEIDVPSAVIVGRRVFRQAGASSEPATA
jgi:hypothetical protein